MNLIDIDEEYYATLKNEKKQKILNIFSNSDIEPNRIKMMAMSRFGLIDNDVRKKMWMAMHKLKPDSTQFNQIDNSSVETHKDYHQVLMDVNRSLKRFPPGMDEVVRMAMQDQLVNLIVKLLIADKDLHYYQGFHDICVTFLLVLSPRESFQLLNKLTQTHFIDFMRPTMDATMQLLYLIYAIIELENRTLIRKLQLVSLEPFFALSWVITWFGHVLGDLPRILRLYDFFLASDPIMPIYLSAAIVLHRHEEVAITEADFGQLHHMLTNLPPPERLPLESLLSATMSLFLRHPPSQLLSCGSLPRELSVQLAGLSNGSGSEILRHKRGPLGDAIDTRMSATEQHHRSSNGPHSIGSRLVQQFSRSHRMNFLLTALACLLLAFILNHILIIFYPSGSRSSISPSSTGAS